MIKGISQNVSPDNLPKEFAFFAKNIILNEYLNEVVNEKGTLRIDALALLGITNIVGVIPFGNLAIIFYIAGSTDSIGVYDETAGTFAIKVARTDLNFDLNFPISGKAKFNSKFEIIVAFTDRNTIPKYINLDTATLSDDVSLYNLFLISKDPDFNAEVVEGGGSFKTGAYFGVIAYVDREGAVSSWSHLSEPIYVTLYSDTQDNRTTQGSNSGVTTSKAIRLNITNLDPAFTKIRIALISKINDVTTAATYKDVSYVGSTATVILTGGEVTTVVGIEEVLTINQIFEKVGDIESLNDQLFVADLETNTVVDFQSLTNQLSLQWTSKLVLGVLDDNTNYPKSGEIKTFMHDEVYAMYAQYELKGKGRWTDWFHIPGRIPTSGERSNSGLANEIRINGVVPKKFQLEDTCSEVGADGDLTYGTMSSWENSNEVYPTDFPDYAGQKIRHHRFPSVNWLKSNIYPVLPPDNNYPHESWDILGIRVNFGSLPPALLEQISGIRIGYAKRDTGNTTILGYDIIQFAANPQETGSGGAFNTSILASSGGNWQIAADGVDNDIRPIKNFIRLHSPDILFTKPPITDIYLALTRKLKVNTLNDAFTNDSQQGRLVTVRIVDESNVATYVTNYRKTTSSSSPINTSTYLKLTNSKYVPNNTQVVDSIGTINNLLSEETLFAQVEQPLDIDVSGVDSGGDLITNRGSEPDSPNLFEETFLTAIKVIKSDMFSGYTGQQVIPLNYTIRDFVDPVIIDEQGDGFIIFHSFVTMAPYPSIGDAFGGYGDKFGVRCVKAFICESRLNLNQRYIDSAILNTYFFPFVGSTVLSDPREYWYFKLSQLNAAVNTILYNRDFNALNDYEQYGVYDHTIEYNSELPYAIARSQKASRASDIDDGWRIFRPNDIFYTVRDKGRIINLQAWGTESLLIHHEKALFRTRDKAILQTDITKITLGSGDLFAIEPEEIAPTDEGYGGTQHKFSCLLCPAGYVFVDKEVGELFMYKQGNTFVPLGKGLRTFFRDTLRNTTVADNPYNGTGMSLAFDKEHYRLILSLKAFPSFTASFDLLKEEWACLHDYKPDFIFNTRKNLYSFKINELHQHGVGPTGSYYGVVYPSFVDIVINEDPDQEKILIALEWITRVIKNNTPSLTDTITHITVWNDYFCTGKIPVNLQTLVAAYENKNTSSANRSWRFNELQDAVKDVQAPFIGGIFDDYRPISDNITSSLAWFNRGQVTGKYFIIRLEYSNFEDKLVYLRTVLGDTKRLYA